MQENFIIQNFIVIGSCLFLKGLFGGIQYYRLQETSNTGPSNHFAANFPVWKIIARRHFVPEQFFHEVAANFQGGPLSALHAIM